MLIQNIVELQFYLWRHSDKFACSRVDPVNEIELLFQIKLLLLQLGLDCLLIDFVAMQHWDPLEARHEFVDDLAHFVSVGSAASENFNVVVAQQALRLQIDILDVETALADLCPCVWTLVRDGHVVVVFLRQSLRTRHGLLYAVLDLSKQEHSIFACVKSRGVHGKVSPTAEHLVLEMLKSVLTSLVEHRHILFGNGWSGLVGDRRQEDSVHVIAQVSNRLRHGHGRYLFKQRLSHEPLLIWAVQKECVWLEVVDGLVRFVDSLNVDDAPISKFIEIHVRLVQLLFHLGETTS